MEFTMQILNFILEDCSVIYPANSAKQPLYCFSWLSINFNFTVNLVRSVHLNKNSIAMNGEGESHTFEVPP